MVDGVPITPTNTTILSLFDCVTSGYDNQIGKDKWDKNLFIMSDYMLYNTIIGLFVT